MRGDSPGVPACFLAEPLEEACGVIDFSSGLCEGFALLEGEDAGEIVLVAEEKRGGSFQDFAAFECGGRFPPGEMGFGMVHGGVEGCCVCESDCLEWVPGGGVVDLAMGGGVCPFSVEPKTGFEPEGGEISHRDRVGGCA